MLLNPEVVAGAQRTLHSLVGLPLSDMWRYCEYQKFEFGEQKPFINRRGEHSTRADFGLAVCCPWSLAGPGFQLSSQDFVPERRDSHADAFYESLEQDPPVVETVNVLENGALRIGLSGGLTLAVDPGPPFSDDQVENWRFMPPRDDPRGHLVLEFTSLSWA